jgi:hypothetical protein
VLNDLVGDGDLTAHGVDGHQRSFELFGWNTHYLLELLIKMSVNLDSGPCTIIR